MNRVSRWASEAPRVIAIQLVVMGLPVVGARADTRPTPSDDGSALGLAGERTVTPPASADPGGPRAADPSFVVLQRRRFPLAGRHLISAGAWNHWIDPGSMFIAPSLAYRYGIGRRWLVGVEAWAAREWTEELAARRDPWRERVLQHRPRYGASSGLAWVPLSGKLNLLAAILHYDVEVQAGGGAQFAEQDVEVDLVREIVTFSGYGGLGFRVHPTESLAIGLVGRVDVARLGFSYLKPDGQFGEELVWAARPRVGLELTLAMPPTELPAGLKTPVAAETSETGAEWSSDGTISPQLRLDGARYSAPFRPKRLLPFVLASAGLVLGTAGLMTWASADGGESAANNAGGASNRTTGAMLLGYGGGAALASGALFGLGYGLGGAEDRVPAWLGLGAESWVGMATAASLGGFAYWVGAARDAEYSSFRSLAMTDPHYSDRKHEIDSKTLTHELLVAGAIGVGAVTLANWLVARYWEPEESYVPAGGPSRTSEPDDPDLEHDK